MKDSYNWYHLLCNRKTTSGYSFAERYDELHSLEKRIIKELNIYRDMSGALALDTGTATYITLGLPEGFYLHKL